MANVAYYRVSTLDQSVAIQRNGLAGCAIDKEFIDEAVSGSIKALDRPAFSKLFEYVRSGDTLFVHAVDRLGRDALDVQTTVRVLMDKEVKVDIKGLGVIAKGVGELIVAVLAQVAEIERRRIVERTTLGRDLAKAALTATGKTHRGKPSMGRPRIGDAAQVRIWKTANPTASIRQLSEKFSLSQSTVKRYLKTSMPFP